MKKTTLLNVLLSICLLFTFNPKTQQQKFNKIIYEESRALTQEQAPVSDIIGKVTFSNTLSKVNYDLVCEFKEQEKKKLAEKIAKNQKKKKEKRRRQNLQNLYVPPAGADEEIAVNFTSHIIVEDSTKNKSWGSLDKMINNAYKYIGVPYRWGGRTPKGFDCLWFTVFIFKKIGYQLPGCAQTIAHCGKYIKKSELKKGDILFFKSRNIRNPRIGHLATVSEIKNGEVFFIHASVKGIRITSLNSNYYKQRYITARRIVKETTS